MYKTYNIIYNNFSNKDILNLSEQDILKGFNAAKGMAMIEGDKIKLRYSIFVMFNYINRL